MDDTKLVESLSQLFGESAANAAAILALIETHPAPGKMLGALDRGLEIMYAVLLSASQSESMLNHFEAHSKKLREQARLALLAQSLRTGDSSPL